jgi:penicillin V acylase-like amidase (Ntn superfamily)
VFSSSRTTFVDWHACLGHPSDRIVRHVISKFQLPYVFNKKQTVYPACQQGKSHQLPFSISENKSSAPLELIFFSSDV